MQSSSIFYVFLFTVKFSILVGRKQCPTSLQQQINYIQNQNADHCSIKCVAGHWPMKQSCHYLNCNNISYPYHFFRGSYDHNQIEYEINTCPKCTNTVPRAILFVLPNSPNNGVFGVNYYVTHIDVLLPLWNAIQKLSVQSNVAAGPVLLMPYTAVHAHPENMDLQSAAFDDPHSHYMHALQLLSPDIQLLPVTRKSLQQALSSGSGRVISVHSSAALCFESLVVGLPDMHSPRHSTVQRYANAFRAAALRGSEFDETVSGRAVEPVEMSFGGRNATLEGDVLSLQTLAVLVGVQGSGLVNGLYLPQTAATVALYLSAGWPLSSGRDPLGVLAARGPYIRFVNQERERVTCNTGSADEFCDNGDITLDRATVTDLVLQALRAHQAECTKLQLTGQ